MSTLCRGSQNTGGGGVVVGARCCASRSLIGVVSLCALIVALFVLPGVASADGGCLNEGRRAEQGSVFLPDCRGYEMVTPSDKDSGEPRAVVPGFLEYILEEPDGMQASVGGERMAWTSEYSLPGSSSVGLYYMSKRGTNGWSSENVIPPQSVENGVGCPFLVGMAGYSPDLSKGVLFDGFGQPGSFHKGGGLSCGHDEPRLVAGEPEGFQNLFLRDNDARSYSLVNVTPPTAPAPTPGPGQNFQYYSASFLAGSNDLSHVVFEEELQITPEALFGDNLYEWDNGKVRLVNVLPDGTPVIGRLAGATRNTEAEEIGIGVLAGFPPYDVANYRHAVSGDGSRVFF